MDPVERMDRYSGWLIYFLVIFTPWAFGTTQTWSIWTANVACYLLGGLWVAKWVYRRRAAVPARTVSRHPWVIGWFGVCMVAFLVLVLVSALNARAEYDLRIRALRYLAEAIAWLPTSYDRWATLTSFAQFFGLGMAFWAVRGWLLAPENPATAPVTTSVAVSRLQPLSSLEIPERVGRLLWLVCLNAGVLAVIGYLQRAAGTSDLLWLIKSKSGKTAEMVFGPWSYRSNAAQYFNLVWPICLGLWLWVQESAFRSDDPKKARFDGPQLLLVLSFFLVTAAPVVSGSRGSALLAVGGLGVAVLVVLLGPRGEIRRGLRNGAAVVLVFGALVAAIAGGAKIVERLGRRITSVPTEGAPCGTDAFTLIARVQVPPVALARHTTLVNLAPASGDWYPRPGFFLMGLNAAGALVLMAQDASTPQVQFAVYPGFVSRFAGRRVDVVAIRGNSLRVFADGEELSTPDRSALAAIHATRLQNRFLEATHPELKEAAFVGAEVPISELRSIASVSLEATVARWRKTAFMRAEREHLIPADSATTRLLSGTANGVIRVERSSGSGAIGLRWLLPQGIPFRVDRWVAKATLAEMGGEDWALSFALEEGAERSEVFTAGGQDSASVVLATPVSGGVKALDLRSVSIDREGDEKPGDSDGFALMDLTLSPAGGLFHWRDEATWMSRGVDSSGRNEIYANAHRMAVDYPVWGIGLGAFQAVYESYRRPYELPAAYVHNDWLELRVCTGWTGLIVVLTGGVSLLVLGLLPGERCAPWSVRSLCWLSIGTVLLNAFLDFPFRVYSVLCLAMILLAVWTVLCEARANPKARL